MTALTWLFIILKENARLIRAALRFSPEYWQRIHAASWFTLKREIIRAQGGKCYDCGRIEMLELHHLHYRNLWHEQYERDVIGLCKQCHREADTLRKLSKHQSSIY